MMTYLEARILTAIRAAGLNPEQRISQEDLLLPWPSSSRISLRSPGTRGIAWRRAGSGSSAASSGRTEQPHQGLAPPGHDELLIAGAQFALEYLGGEQHSPGSDAAGLGSMSRADQTVLEELRTPALLVSRGPRRLTKIILFPVRFLFTAATGQVGTNARAVDHYLADPQAPAAELVVTALDWRHAPPQDDDQAAALLGRDLVPLYLHFIDDYSARLLAFGRSDLTERFQEWRARLLA